MLHDNGKPRSSKSLKLGVYRGKLPHETTKERRLQRELYLKGLLKLVYSQDHTVVVRLTGYEIPLWEACTSRRVH